MTRNVECHLGDVPGGLEPVVLPPYRSAFADRDRRGSVEWLKHTFLAWVAVLIFGMLIALFVAMAFLFAAPSSLAPWWG